ncbi:3alpha(or 20beta)-hydroxysteroid dehydrogenase [Jatrophihabitans endophyticus]|uniref:3alpha(Or 20beta)-hydroxysteroid dehydrogenase n=1 Tax=Jatrophihabitans endophyticus TaxID=1206085 RepID=A0A1M5RRQ8_9ACTN|nr:SDR family oxidoreductase [Jatrophihabitans endophyticus]SHH28811.1 3alpha(or 20beta)-hydroxysteroid dehydrogenase [Jatrophihabitans endophyticus]
MTEQAAHPLHTGRLAGKIVVVTGAARGQGAAEARALAAEGALVISTDVLDFDADGAESQPWAQGNVVERRLDVTDADGWAQLADWLRGEHGRVDALVNNAGVAARERLPHVSLDQWHRTFDVNVTGPLLGMQALVPLMAPGSSIVNICSVAAVSGHAAAAYTASKWALRGLSRSASLELGERGIRVNAIMPGLIDTPLMASASPAFADAAVAEVPLGRMGVPADIAPTVVFLVSDDSAYYNGAEIVIDGGLTAHVSHKGIADATRPPGPPG